MFRLVLSLCCVGIAMLAVAPLSGAAEPTTQPGPVPPSAPETPEQRDARMGWWRDARFGMFIHWGVYSVPAGVYDGKDVPGIGEWIMNHAKIPVARYAEYAKQFDPEKFNAEQWVNIAKSAGMKYVVITAKHHDGFAMFHTHVDDYNIYDATPFHRDPLAELSAACQKAGMHLGFYYSQCQDWHHPGGAAIGGHWDKAQDGDFATYIRTVAQPQVKELLTNYGPVAVLWYDTPTSLMTHDLAEPFVTLMHQYQPQIIFNNRLGGGFHGDTETPEQFVPPNGYPGRDWETCMTMNDTWGYKVHDQDFKSTQTLLHNLIDIASKGGNYLLNVGPTSEGIIPQPEVDRLEAIGKWLDVNGEAIYGTTASPFKHALDFGRVTQKPNHLFLCIFDKPADNTLWLPMKGKITKAYILPDQDESLELGTADGGVTIKLPADAKMDPDATVVVADVDGPVDAFVPPIKPDAKGVFDLRLVDADTTGKMRFNLRRKGRTVTNNLSFTANDDTASWDLTVPQAGNYRIDLTAATDPEGVAGSNGVTFAITAGDQQVSATLKLPASTQPVRSGDSPGDPAPSTATAGPLALPAGAITLKVHPTDLAEKKHVTLQSIRLTPQ